jgi:pimeloyl-ACP methyl ester carboxylesterase
MPDLETATAGTVTSKDGTRIAFDRHGTAPISLVLVGGAFTDRQGLTPLAQALAPHFSVYPYDRRGRGGSGDTAPYAVEREVEDLAAVIEEAGGADTRVFGHSSGAALALRAVADGVAVGGLVLYEPPFIVDDERRAIPSNFSLRQAELVAADRRDDAVALWMAHTVQLPEEAIAGMRRSPMWPALVAMAHTTVYDLAIMSGTMSGNQLPEEWSTTVTVPALVIVGGKSESWIQNSTQALADLLPDARRHVLPGADHGAEPAALVPVLREFFTAS